MTPPVHIARNVIPSTVSAGLRQSLIEQVQWEVHDTDRREALFLRRAWPYFYSKERGPRPLHYQPEPHALRLIWDAVERHTGHLYEACFINHYMGSGGNLGWHADNSPSIDQRRPVSVLTLGVQ